MPDALMQLLAGLPATDLESARAERIRRRCHARLARRTADRSGSGITLASAWQPLVAALAVVYFIGAIVEAMRLSGLS